MATTTPERRTMTVEEAARLLGIGRGHAYELARRGELPGCFKLGRRFIVSRDALERLLADPSSIRNDAATQR